MRKFTVMVDGRQMPVSEELVAILNEHYFANETAKRPLGLIEGEWFEIVPEEINKKLFKERRKSLKEEFVRECIQKAFAEMRKNPEKYARPFEVMWLKKIWRDKKLSELLQLSKCIGDGNADWVHQALEWAQRIHNGETWESICSEADTALLRRIVIWKDGHVRFVGGACLHKSLDSPTRVVHARRYAFNTVEDAVPSIIRYK